MSLAVDFPDLQRPVPVTHAHSPTSPLSPRFNSMGTTSTATPVGSDSRDPLPDWPTVPGYSPRRDTDAPESPRASEGPPGRAANRGVWDSANRTAGRAVHAVGTDGKRDGGPAVVPDGDGVKPTRLAFESPAPGEKSGTPDGPPGLLRDAEDAAALEAALEQYASSKCSTPTCGNSAGGQSLDSLLDIVLLDETAMELDTAAFSSKLARWEAQRAALKPLERRTRAEAAHMLRLLRTRQAQIEDGWGELCSGAGLDPATGQAINTPISRTPSGASEDAWAPAHADEVRWCAARLAAIGENLARLQEAHRDEVREEPSSSTVFYWKVLVFCLSVKKRPVSGQLFTRCLRGLKAG